MKRRKLLVQMVSIARSYGVEFDQSHPAHGGKHDRFMVGKQAVEVPRHDDQ